MHGRYHLYRATVRPWLWFLTRTADCRIFQDMSAPDIIKKVFQDHPIADFELKTTLNYPKREYCVQYRETDYNFVSRLMEEEGIYFFFKHADGRHTLVLADSYSAHQPFEGYAQIPFVQVERTSRIEQEYIHEWNFAREVQPGRYVLDDFDFKKPSVDLEVKTNQKRSHEHADNEMYDYPGNFLTTGDGNQIVRTRLDELQARFELANGSTNARGVCVGSLFKLTGQPRSDQNREYLVLSRGVRAGILRVRGDGERRNELRLPVPGAREQDAVPAAAPHAEADRPGPADGDRRRSLGRRDLHRQVRAREGAVSLGPLRQEGREQLVLDPRLASVGGQELGRGGHPAHRPGSRSSTSSKAIPTGRSSPAASTTRSRCRRTSCRRTRRRPGIKSRSQHEAAAAANFNEIRFEDKKGEEQVYIHAEKNQDNDRRERRDDRTSATIARRRSATTRRSLIGVDRTENVGNNETITIGVNRTETVGANETITIGANRTITVGASETETVALQRTHTVGVNETIAVGAAQEIAIGAFQAVAIGAYQTINVGANQSTNVGANQIDQRRCEPVDVTWAQIAPSTWAEPVDERRQGRIALGNGRPHHEHRQGRLRSRSARISSSMPATRSRIKTGSASITMKKDGTIVIKGKDITVEGSGKINVKATSDIVMKGSKILQN